MQVLALVAERITDEIRAAAGGDLASLVVLPMSVASHMVALTPRAARANLPVTMVANGKAGVTLRALQDYIAGKTRNQKPETRNQKPKP
jgi:hypothetical protein